MLDLGRNRRRYPQRTEERGKNIGLAEPIDPWVHTQIRLARRQGLLNGPRVSPIQSYASIVLDTIEMRDKALQQDRELRLALLASGQVDREDWGNLFTELSDIVVEDDDAADIDDEEEDVSTRWDFSNAELNRSQEQVEAEIRAMLASASSGSVSFEAPTYEGWL